MFTKKMKHEQGVETIAAIATPLGVGGVGIIRASGPGALDLANRIFVPACASFAGVKPYRLHHGWIRTETGRTVDEVLISFMPGPGSYTGEDVLEINCHGGPAVIEEILGMCLSSGCRMAEPGEFTKRALLNGRMDLSQAESVLEVINARTSSSLAFAQEKLSGALRENINVLTRELEYLRRQFCLAVDFPEEDLECFPEEFFFERLGYCLDSIRTLIANYDRASVWKDGAMVALAGRVNAGKSSLMNCMLGRQRSIVTEIAGTTRDYIEEEINVRGLPLRLVDTAGLRDSEDVVEQAGVERCRELILEADVLLLVIDSTIGVHDEDLRIIDDYSGKKVLVAANKSDLADHAPLNPSSFEKDPKHIINVSAKTGEGVENLLSSLRGLLVGDRSEPESGIVVPNARQKDNLKKAAAELEGLLRDFKQGIPFDLLGTRLDCACDFLSAITGEIVHEDILNSIFDNFCIGK
ncbi:MAG: tRNA uridine-5-carboxymethylaminomethyl(34) synthesis GTPase MnmE [Desulfovibrionales bacterium]